MSREEIRTAVQKAIDEVLSMWNIEYQLLDEDRYLYDMGLDSIDIVDVATRLENEFDIEVDTEVFFYGKIRRVIDYVKSLTDASL